MDALRAAKRERIMRRPRSEDAACAALGVRHISSSCFLDDEETINCMRRLQGAAPEIKAAVPADVLRLIALRIVADDSASAYSAEADGTLVFPASFGVRKLVTLLLSAGKSAAENYSKPDESSYVLPTPKKQGDGCVCM